MFIYICLDFANYTIYKFHKMISFHLNRKHFCDAQLINFCYFHFSFLILIQMFVLYFTEHAFNIVRDDRSQPGSVIH
jgi:low temperature requirement protein LtrA